MVPRAEALSISPLIFEINVNPGDEISNVIKVFNTSETDSVTVSMSTENFVAAGEEGKVVVVDDDLNRTFSLSQWVTLEPRTFTIGPKQQQIINFTVKIPIDGEPGGHYGSILAQISGSSGSGGGGAVAISQKIGSLLLVQVAGDVEEKLWIKSMSAGKKASDGNFLATNFLEYGPVILATRYENIGTVHLKPRGFILIKDMFGREVANITLEQLNVLPNSIRRIDTTFDKRLLLGKYTATLTAIYGSKNEPLTYTTTFWGFPWKIGGAIGFGVLVALIFLIRGRKRIRVAFKVLLKGHHV